MPQPTDYLSTIRVALEGLLEQHHIAALKRLFWKILQLEERQATLPRAEFPPGLANSLAEDPVLFAAYGALVVIDLCLTAPGLSITMERALVAHLHRSYSHAIFVFSNCERRQWHFVHLQPLPEHSANAPEAASPFSRKIFRRLVLKVEEDCPFAASRLAHLGRQGLEASPRMLEAAVEATFDWKALETRFVRAWQCLFERIKANLVDQTGDAQWAGAYALQFLDRSLLRTMLWRAHGATDFSQRDVLSFHAPWEQLPFGEIESRASVAISETLVGQVDTILAQIPLSLVEDTSLDRTLAISPAILGTVYERLGADRNERTDAGVYYTPVTEVDLMCRLALVSFLTNRFGEHDRGALYTVVFALDPQDEVSALETLRSFPAGSCQQIRAALTGMRALDPASGSGAFLIGMLRLLNEMQRLLSLVLQEDLEDPADRVKAIIERNLFGIDVQAGAQVRASARLWCAWLSCQSNPERARPPRPNLACSDCFFLPALHTAFESFPVGVAGVDLVIGNPPYLRHERLRDPSLPADQAGKPEARTAYKRALAEQITQSFPYFFPGGRHKRSLDGKSDLYLYFFFRGLALLNQDGVLCYVTPSTWLDVAYGTVLQEFFLRHCRLELILDNQLNSSFVEAAVNTVITLASAPVPRSKTAEEWNLLVRFVALWIPFEQALHARIFQEIAGAQTHYETVHLRIHPISHLALFEDGCQ